MKKYISVVLTALLTLVMFSCKKDADVSASEAQLPNIQLSSLGYQQLPPFTSTTVLQLLFGATATNNSIASVKLEFFTGTSVPATGTAFKTVTFSTIPTKVGDSAKDDSSVGTVTNHTISYVLEPTTYQNTKVYGGSILLKLSALALTSQATYSVRATITGANGKTSVLSQGSFIRMQ